MSLELLTDAHVSMCRIDVQTSRSRDKGKVQKAKTLFALSPILFVLQKNCQEGAISSADDYFSRQNFLNCHQSSKKWTEPSASACFGQYFTTNASLALLTLMFLNTHRLFLMAVPDKVILSIFKLLFAEPVLLIEASYFNRIKLTQLWNWVCSVKAPSSFSSLQFFKHFFFYKTMFTTVVNTCDVERSCTWTLVMTCPCHRSKWLCQPHLLSFIFLFFTFFC